MNRTVPKFAKVVGFFKGMEQLLRSHGKEIPVGGEQTSAQMVCALGNSPRWPQTALPPCWAPREPVCRLPSDATAFAAGHQEASGFPWAHTPLPELHPNLCPRCAPPPRASGRSISSSAQPHQCTGGTSAPVQPGTQLPLNSKQANSRSRSKAALCPGGRGGIKRGIINKKKP